MTQTNNPTLLRKTKKRVEQDHWYYQMELSPGEMTDGAGFPSTSMTRKMLANIDLAGTSCLDIGCQEAFLCVLMARQNARYVAAYDRLDLSPMIDRVKTAFDVDFDYIHSLELHDLAAATAARGHDTFDVTVFAGVLYHMMDPLSGLARARRLMRDGGIAIVETAAFSTPEMDLKFNAGGSRVGDSTYFHISIPAFDYMLRMMRLKPVDVLFIHKPTDAVVRTSVVCQAIEGVIAGPGDTWMTSDFVEMNRSTMGCNQFDTVSDKPQVAYTPVGNNLQFRDGTDCVDLWATYQEAKPHVYDKDDVRLYLKDMK